MTHDMFPCIHTIIISRVISNIKFYFKMQSFSKILPKELTEIKYVMKKVLLFVFFCLKYFTTSNYSWAELRSIPINQKIILRSNKKYVLWLKHDLMRNRLAIYSQIRKQTKLSRRTLTNILTDEHAKKFDDWRIFPL